MLSVVARTTRSPESLGASPLPSMMRPGGFGGGGDEVVLVIGGKKLGPTRNVSSIFGTDQAVLLPCFMCSSKGKGPPVINEMSDDASASMNESGLVWWFWWKIFDNMRIVNI